MNKRNTENIAIGGINHITFSVANLEKSIDFYKIIFGEKLVAKSEKLAYFDVNGIWFALNVESDIKSEKRQKTYTHVAFSMTKANQNKLKEKLDRFNVSYNHGRARSTNEGSSLYIRDYDGHLIEFHNKNLSDRLNYYLEARDDIEVFR